MNREQMIQKAAQGLHRESGCGARNLPHGADAHRHQAQAVLDAILPQITDPKQLTGVPENALLTAEWQGNAWPFYWQQGQLTPGDLLTRRDPQDVIEQFGPLTVVWQP